MFYALIGLLNAISSSFLGLFVYIKNPKAIINKTFGIFCFFLAFWSYFYFFWQISNNGRAALLLSRLLMCGAIFIPISYLHFVFSFTQETRKNIVKIVLFSGYLISFFFLASNFTSLFITDVKPRLDFKFWPSAGPLYTPFLIIWFFYAVYSIILLIKSYRHSIGVKKFQLSYIFLGTICGYLGGATNYFLWYDIPIPPLGNWAITLYIFLVTYAIAKYRLMDIRLVLGRGAVYLFSFALVIGLALGLMFSNTLLPNPLATKFTLPLILVIGILVFQPIFRLFEKLASRYFYYTFYSYQKVLTDLGKKMAAVLDLDTLNSLIADTLIGTMKLDKTGILLRDVETGAYQIQKIIGFKEENGISLVRDNFLTDYLARTKKPLVYEEIGLAIRDAKEEGQKQKLKVLRANMEKIEAAICLPLFREEKIIGIIVLGNKISGEAYSQQDMELLITLSNQASIALENARLYDQIQDLSKNLQKKVDEQTREIREAYEVEKKARKELQRLDAAKTQFIMATQHHLRTPLTSMRGYLDLIFGGSYGKVPKKLGGALKKFQVSTQRLIRIVNEFLDISQLQLGKKVISLKPNVSLEPVLEEIIEELKFEAESKGLGLKFKKPKKPLPKIKADSEKLKVALFNIIDNGIKYTSKGEITIDVKPQGPNVRIAVKDKGIGMPKEDVKGLFDKTFERGKRAKEVHGTGRGIGLFITSHIIKAHRGKIWAESEGENKGSTFYIELPIRDV